MQKYISYEHPLNELTRVCFKLEYLFKQLELLPTPQKDKEYRERINTLVKIMHLCKRNDLKSRFINAFQQKIRQYSPLLSHQDIDKSQLEKLLAQLRKYTHYFDQLKNDSLVQELLDNAFLSNLLQRLSIPAGDAPCESPAYHFWLQQSSSDKNKQLENWISILDMIKNSGSFYLELIRNNYKTQPSTAHQGYFQTAIEQNNIAYAKVILLHDIKAYPVISANISGLNIQFQTLTHNSRDTPYPKDVEFELQYA
jgi:cell division protein ZapD